MRHVLTDSWFAVRSLFPAYSPGRRRLPRSRSTNKTGDGRVAAVLFSGRVGHRVARGRGPDSWLKTSRGFFRSRPAKFPEVSATAVRRTRGRGYTRPGRIAFTTPKWCGKTKNRVFRWDTCECYFEIVKSLKIRFLREGNGKWITVLVLTVFVYRKRFEFY